MGFINRYDTTAALTATGITKYTSADGTTLVQAAVSYTALKGEPLIEVTDTTAARTITIPDARTIPAGSKLVVKDGYGTANSFNITLATAGITPDVDGMQFQTVPSGSDLGTVVAATTAALPTCIAAGTGVGKTLTGVALAAIVIDGVTPSAADAVLVKNQVNPLDNGLYTVTTVGSGAAAFVLTRKTTFDQVAECLPGSVASISAGGTTNGSTKWALRGGIDGAKTKVISAAFGKVDLFCNGLDWRTLI